MTVTRRTETCSATTRLTFLFVIALATSPLCHLNTVVEAFGTSTYNKHTKTLAVANRPADSTTELAVGSVNGQEQEKPKKQSAASSFINEIKKRLNWRNTNAAISNDLYMSEATQRIANIEISWEPEMAERILELQQERLENDEAADGRPLMIGVVGIPGSGKSTSCDIMQRILGDQAIVMPMDGYHYSLEKLEKFPNPVDAIYRRGAPDTFDPASLKSDLTRILHNPNNEDLVSIPGFDHAKGDPTPNQHTFDRNKHKIVICEGIYLMHDNDGWEEIKDLIDHSIYIVADIDQCISRLKERNKCIPGYTPEEIDIRCDAVDRVNAQLAEMSRRYATDEVYSAASSSLQECDVVDVDDLVEDLDLTSTDEEGEEEEEEETPLENEVVMSIEETNGELAEDKMEKEELEVVAADESENDKTVEKAPKEEEKVSYYF